MAKIKTSELTDAALDWAVAKCENPEWSDEDAIVNVTTLDEYDGTICNYSTDWAQGGPIIERMLGFELKNWIESTPATRCEAHIHNYDGNWIAFGPTPLIAAMRCFVASKLGEEVEIPEELT